ncbi:MAG: hypothetical protein LUD78_03250, partial [Clostridiales bacterium]|nr:hypothetical protein [Clostridiales bacterium]
ANLLSFFHCLLDRGHFRAAVVYLFQQKEKPKSKPNDSFHPFVEARQLTRYLSLPPILHPQDTRMIPILRLAFHKCAGKGVRSKNQKKVRDKRYAFGFQNRTEVTRSRG